MVDPNLERHLAHFGLDMKTLTKTEKSTVELELDMNQASTVSRGRGREEGRSLRMREPMRARRRGGV